MKHIDNFYLTAKDIASMIHSVTCRIPRPDGSPVAEWNNISEVSKEMAYRAVRDIYASEPRSAEELHELWMNLKLEEGWVCGDFSVALKTHPCIVHFNDLPPSEICKDYIWSALTEAFRQFYTDEDTDSVLGL